MLGRPRLCGFSCGSLIAWDNEEGYFVEPENNNEPHNRERCKSLGGGIRVQGSTSTSMSRDVVRAAVKEDLQMAILKELRKANTLLAKIAGVED